MRREFSAGGLVYKKVESKTWWLIRRPTPNPEYRGNLGWSFPKGWVEGRNQSSGSRIQKQETRSQETVEEAAVREVGEEGGVEAKIVAKLPTIKIFFTDQRGEKVMKFVMYFVMEYVKDLPEGWGEETEEARWVTGEEAEEMLAFKSEKELLKRAIDLVSN